MKAGTPYLLNIINNEKPNSEFNFGKYRHVLYEYPQNVIRIKVRQYLIKERK